MSALVAMVNFDPDAGPESWAAMPGDSRSDPSGAFAGPFAESPRDVKTRPRPSGSLHDDSELRRLCRRRPFRRRRAGVVRAGRRAGDRAGVRPSAAAHEGAVLCAGRPPLRRRAADRRRRRGGVLDDAEGVRPLHRHPGRWIDALDASRESGLYAFAIGRELHVRDSADARFERAFRHERSVAARWPSTPRGGGWRRRPTAGAALWWARIAEQKPQMLKWAGSHIGVVLEPGRPLRGLGHAGERPARLAAVGRQGHAHGRLSGQGEEHGLPLARPADGERRRAGGGGLAVQPEPTGRWAGRRCRSPGSKAPRSAGWPPRLGGSRLAGGRTDGSVWIADVAGQGVRELVPAERRADLSARHVGRRGPRGLWRRGRARGVIEP